MEEPGGLQSLSCTESDTTERLHFPTCLSYLSTLSPAPCLGLQADLLLPTLWFTVWKDRAQRGLHESYPRPATGQSPPNSPARPVSALHHLVWLGATAPLAQDASGSIY